MKVILWADNHNFPSLPLMKISAYHKAKGDTVRLYESGFDKCDILYKSKTFSFTQDLDYYPRYDYLIQGGSGYALKAENGKEVYCQALDKFLSDEIEIQYPDYNLYPQYKNIAHGFLTRGCPNDCSFCIVSKKEGKCSKQVADLSEFWQGQKDIKLMDGNLLACKDREKILQQVIDSNAKIDFTQGLDARFITDDIARLICKCKISMVHFAFDFMKNEKQILKGLEIFNKHFNKSDRHRKVYVLTNYDTTHEEDYYRVKKVIELGYRPDIRIYQKGTHDRFLTDLARWANSDEIYRSCKFEEYVPRKDGKTCKELYFNEKGDIKLLISSI